MKVLVVNCGSSSLKYQVLEMDDSTLLAKGLVERIGIDGSVMKHEKIGMDKYILEAPMKNHKDAIGYVLEALTDKEHGVVTSMDEISAVGHRVVHAGEKYASSVLITQDVMDALEECIDLAPLHNPPNILGIRACQELMPETPMVGVFDTAFHQTMKPENYLYAIPYEYYEKYKIRKYGFHGTSHKYVSMRAAAMLNKDVKDIKVVTCHLGNGASCAAVKNGVCIDTSMGFTPLDGLVMGTRSGAIDPAVITFIAEKEGIGADEVINILNKKSGVAGISGVSSDFRDLEEAEAQGNERATLALQVFAMRVKSFIGSYMAKMNGADCIVFTAGVGENDPSMRKLICSDMEGLGVELDDEKNNVRGKETVISKDSSKVKVMLIPTNEELTIAQDTVEIVGKLK
ncbi:MAG: acetate kinase [Clostridiales bacterium]|nr:acetate kinase [Clostridiales bacterium]